MVALPRTLVDLSVGLAKSAYMLMMLEMVEEVGCLDHGNLPITYEAVTIEFVTSPGFGEVLVVEAAHVGFEIFVEKHNFDPSCPGLMLVE